MNSTITTTRRASTRPTTTKRSAVSRWRRGRRGRSAAPLAAVAFGLAVMAFAVVELFEFDAKRAAASAGAESTVAVEREAQKIEFEYDVVELARDAGL